MRRSYRRTALSAPCEPPHSTHDPQYVLRRAGRHEADGHPSRSSALVDWKPKSTAVRREEALCTPGLKNGPNGSSTLNAISCTLHSGQRSVLLQALSQFPVPVPRRAPGGDNYRILLEWRCGAPVIPRAWPKRSD